MVVQVGFKTSACAVHGMGNIVASDRFFAGYIADLRHVTPVSMGLLAQHRWARRCWPQKGRLLYQIRGWVTSNQAYWGQLKGLSAIIRSMVVEGVVVELPGFSTLRKARWHSRRA